VPESFNVLVRELRGLALDMRIYDDKQRRIALDERDEEIIAQESSSF
jgi:DNA-directed RNA polymerase subunit beta